MKQPYLVQRGNFRKEDNINKPGLDKVLEFDYMGSAEFEWGALPKSLNRIREKLIVDSGRLKLGDKDSYSLISWGLNGVNLKIFCRTGDEFQVAKYFTLLAENKIRCKERTNIDIALGYCKSFGPTKINFWWDIENDWMVFIGKGKNCERFLNAMYESQMKYLYQNN